MLGYHEEKEFESRLRKIILHSSDVLPEAVSAYLERIADEGCSEENLEVIKEYVPLIDHIPKEYVDFACSVLIADIEKIHEERCRSTIQPIGDSFDSEIYDGIYKLGIAYDFDFFPPSHIQGPFLYLLRKNEDEGLRLIQTLANTATTRWREFQQGRYQSLFGTIKKPLATQIDLSSGSLEFWGDEQVYQWYRPHGNGPNVVKSGLMALEVWIDEQIEKGRSPEELFCKILSKSNCVAVLGICLGISLAYPERCLRAALPIVCSTAIWRMDIRRLGSDLTYASTSCYFDPFGLGLNKYICKAEDERNKRPQRSKDVRSLATCYLFYADDATRSKFVDAVMRFDDNLPFLFEEEKGDTRLTESLRRNMELYQALGNRDNYRAKRVDDHFEIWPEIPEDIRKISEAVLEPVIKSQLLFRLGSWAEKSIEIDNAAEGMTIEDAVAAVKELQKPEDFSLPYDLSNFPDILRLQAIAGVAAAILVIDFQHVKDLGLIDWCRDTLLAAACMPYDGIYSKETIIPMNPKISAARGLSIIAAHCEEANKDIGNYILSLVCDPYVETVKAVFIGLHNVWRVDKPLCWDALCLGISLCLCPKELAVERSDVGREAKFKRIQNLYSQYSKNYNKNKIPKIPRIPSNENKFAFDWKLAFKIAFTLPLPDLIQNREIRTQLLQFTDDLISWIVETNMSSITQDHRMRESVPLFANYSVMMWASNLTKELSLEEARLHVLNPIKKTWPDAPNLTGELLGGYINHHIAFIDAPSEKSQASWREICNWMLDSPIIKKIEKSDYIDSKLSEALSKIIFVGLGGSLIANEWQHITLFYDVFDKWVGKIGHNPNMYVYLLQILNGPGWLFAPSSALKWLHQCAANSSNIQDFWRSHQNGERTASLLQRLWTEFEDQIRNNDKNSQIYSYLVDSLVAAGVGSAALLQQGLEMK